MAASIRIKKEDVAFLIAQAAFMIFAVIRFYDRSFIPMDHMPLDALYDRHTACIGCAIYFFVILLFSLVTLVSTDEEKKSLVAFLLTAMSVVMVPVYLPENYLGVIDMYSAIMGFLALTVLQSKKAIRYVGIIIFLIIRWDIISAATWGVWLVAFVFYLTFRTNEGDDNKSLGEKRIALIATVVLFLAALAIPVKGQNRWDGSALEPRYELTLQQGILTVLFLMPLVFLFIRQLWRLASARREFLSRFSYYCLFFSALPGFAVWFLAGDHYRSIYYAAAEMILSMLVLVRGESLSGSEHLSNGSTWDTSRWGRVFLLLYLIFVMINFMYGRPLLLEEQLLKY